MINLDEEIRWILGRPNFWCGPIAHKLRARGFTIAEKAEDEQAVVIHWMLTMYEKHGGRWREEATAFLQDREPSENASK